MIVNNTKRHNLAPCKIQQKLVQHPATPLQLKTLSNCRPRSNTINGNCKNI